MKERIIEFLKAENKSSAQFAEEIGVQPSGISHILSGRNNPSLDFILKMLDKYRFISTEWLLFGKGPIYKDTRMQSLFEDMEVDAGKKEGTAELIQDARVNIRQTDAERQSSVPQSMPAKDRDDHDVNKIVLFYSDGTFEEYLKR